MTTIATESRARDAETLRWGTWLMGAAAAGFIGYAVIFFVMNFTDSFLELGIGPHEVDVGREEIEAFSPSLREYVGHLHIATAGFIAATGLAVLFLVAYGVRKGELWAWVGGSPRTHLPRRSHLRGGGCTRPQRTAQGQNVTVRQLENSDDDGGAG